MKRIKNNNTAQTLNGQPQPIQPMVQSAMFYPNTYLNFNGNGEYTKHYYNGTERIASRLGDNTTTIALNNNILEDRKLSLEEHFREDIHKLIEETVPIDMPPFIDVNTLQPTGTPNDIYYYHPNHLGNTAFITDNNATITQGFLYAPFGEITTEYNINFGNNVIPKYSFNAKELDEETGMYYYEARYYKPPVFTSRDPMFEKYFWMTPYAYCANNPVKYVDPSGRTPIERAIAVAAARALIGVAYKSPLPEGSNAKSGQLDCSGLVRYAIMQNNNMGDPFNSQGNGVTQLVNSSRKIEINDIREGDIVVIKSGENENGHVGFVTNIERDENGNVIKYSMLHSEAAWENSNGVSGGGTINEVVINVGSERGYARSKYNHRFYQWDTTDSESNQSLQLPPNTPAYFNKGKPQKLSEKLFDYKMPITDLAGSILNLFGL